MADWDADSLRLQENLERTLRSALQHARERRRPTPALVKAWHADILDGLQVPNAAYVGRFRGEGQLKRVEIFVGQCPGAAPDLVAGAVRRLMDDLAGILKPLDAAIPVGGIPDSEDALEAVLTTAAIAHARWVEIHPFANGNGRTARLWANWVLMRYGIPPFVRLRPRPAGHSYALAARLALCEGDYEPTIKLFLRMYDTFALPNEDEHR